MYDKTPSVDADYHRPSYPQETREMTLPEKATNLQQAAERLTSMVNRHREAIANQAEAAEQRAAAMAAYEQAAKLFYEEVNRG